MLEQAKALHRERQFAEAERLYREILRQEPENAQVGYMLGQLGMDVGMPEAALPVLERVRTLDPGNAGVYNDIGKCLHMMGRLEEAVASFNRAIILQPGLIDAYNNRALSLYALGRIQEAADSFEQALALAPNSPVTLANSATALVWLGRHEEALTRINAALDLSPTDASLIFNRAEVYKRLRRHDAAIADYDQALTLAPDYAGAHFNRGLLLARLGRFEEALAALDQAIVLEPGSAAIHVSRGMTLARLERFDEALQSLDNAMAVASDFPDGYISRCLVLARMGRTEEAIAYGRELMRHPAFKNDAEFNLALLLLQRGDWEEGWKLYESRKHFAGAPRYSRPEWLGAETLDGKTLHVHAEQGAGDVMQFCRFLLPLKAKGARLLFSAPQSLSRMLANLDPDIVILPPDAAPPCDYETSLMSLPFILGAREDSLPQPPYLNADPALAAAWKARIGEQGLKVGVCWTSSVNTSGFNMGLERSFPLALLAPLAALAGVRLISLQKGEGLAELANLPAGMRVENLGPDYDKGDYADTAAIIANLDLVISPDTSVAHVAGVQARPVWLALDTPSEWRWGLRDSTTPWYPTMTMFRQKRPGAWESVFAAMQERLAAMAGAKNFKPRSEP